MHASRIHVMYHFVNRLCLSKVINMRTSTHTHTVICQPYTLQTHSNKYNTACTTKEITEQRTQNTHTTNSKIHVELCTHTHAHVLSLTFAFTLCLALSLLHTHKSQNAKGNIFTFAVSFCLAIYHTLKPCAICARFKNAQRTFSQVQQICLTFVSSSL